MAVAHKGKQNLFQKDQKFKKNFFNKNQIVETGISWSTLHQKKIQLNILSHRQTTDAKLGLCSHLICNTNNQLYSTITHTSTHPYSNTEQISFAGIIQMHLHPWVGML